MDAEAILVPDPASFETLIFHLMSSVNEQRSQAESIFNLLKQNDPNSLALKLAHFLSSSAHLESRVMAAILLRKQLTRGESFIWPHLSKSTRSDVTDILLSAIQHEKSKSIIKKLWDTVSELASSLIPDNQWPAILPFIFQCVTSRSPVNPPFLFYCVTSSSPTYEDEEVRKAVVLALPELLRSAKLVLEKEITMTDAWFRYGRYAGQLSMYIVPALFEAIPKEPDTDICANMLEALKECVQAHAAVLNVGKIWSLELSMNEIVDKLLVLLQNSKQMVQESALTALASVADSSKELFKKYYVAVMPSLTTILVNATDKSNRMLCAKAMECISFVGMAVGKDIFKEDAKKVMDVVLMSLQGSQMETNDPTTSCMSQAWARLCKCLGRDFSPYMSLVMDSLLQSAQLKPDVTITSDSDDEIDELDDESIETITLCDKRFKTSVLEEKANACNMLCFYAVELKEGFYPWIDKVVETLVPLLEFYFHEVRKAAVTAMPELLRSAKLAVVKGIAKDRKAAYVKQLSRCIILALVEALHKEHDTEICANMAGALNECVQIIGHLLDEDQVRSIVDEIKRVLTASSSREKERAERAKAEDFDAEEGELLKEENKHEEVFDQVGKILGTLIKTFKDSFLPSFDELSSHLTLMWGKDKTAEEKRIVICTFYNVAEQCGKAALKYYDTYLPFLLEACNDENAVVRQAAVYGLVVCAEFGGSMFKPFVGEALSRLYDAARYPNALQPKNVMACDNALSALGKICQLHCENSDYKIGWRTFKIILKEGEGFESSHYEDIDIIWKFKLIGMLQDGCGHPDNENDFLYYNKRYRARTFNHGLKLAVPTMKTGEVALVIVFPNHSSLESQEELVFYEVELISFQEDMAGRSMRTLIRNFNIPMLFSGGELMDFLAEESPQLLQMDQINLMEYMAGADLMELDGARLLDILEMENMLEFFDPRSPEGIDEDEWYQQIVRRAVDHRLIDDASHVEISYMQARQIVIELAQPLFPFQVFDVIDNEAFTVRLEFHRNSRNDLIKCYVGGVGLGGFANKYGLSDGDTVTITFAPNGSLVISSP